MGWVVQRKIEGRRVECKMAGLMDGELSTVQGRDYVDKLASLLTSKTMQLRIDIPDEAWVWSIKDTRARRRGWR